MTEERNSSHTNPEDLQKVLLVKDIERLLEEIEYLGGNKIHAIISTFGLYTHSVAELGDHSIEDLSYTYTQLLAIMKYERLAFKANEEPEPVQPPQVTMTVENIRKELGLPILVDTDWEVKPLDLTWGEKMDNLRQGFQENE